MMKINNQAQLQGMSADSRHDIKKEEVGIEFERLFARQLVQEMTKDLFKQDDNKGMMTSGRNMYRNHIVDSLSQSLAEQEQLGISEMITRHWDLDKE